MYTQVLTGKQEDEPRWKECLDLASQNLPIATGALYVRKYFKQDSKDIAQEMMESIIEEFETILKAVPWMDVNTREAAQSKMRTMIYNIGYPNELMDDYKLVEFYKLLNVDENNFFDSIFNTKKFEIDRSFKVLYEPFNKSDWRYFSGASVVNAFYDSTKNSIGKLKSVKLKSNSSIVFFYRISSWNSSRPPFFS